MGFHTGVTKTKYLSYRLDFKFTYFLLEDLIRKTKQLTDFFECFFFKSYEKFPYT